MTYWDDFVFEETVATGNNEIHETSIEIYPNPAHDFLTINNLKKIQCIDIQSLAGVTIWSSGFSGELSVTIPVSGLPDGLYIIRILSSGKLITRKFIKKAR